MDKIEDTSAGIVTIHLIGRLKVTSSEGENITPRSSKGQGLFALLATDKDCVRSRSWIQKRLWSDRGKQQSSSSLRQELTQIRKRLGKFAHIIGSDRKSVWLRPQHISIIGGDIVGTSGFLEGIEIRDKQFNLWLAAERAERSKNAKVLSTPVTPKNGLKINPQAKDYSIAIIGRSANDAASKAIESQFLDATLRSLGDLCDAKIQSNDQLSLESYTLLIGVEVLTFPNSDQSIRLTVESTEDASTKWSETLKINTDRQTQAELGVEGLALINRLFSAVCQQFAEPQVSSELIIPSRLASLAIFKSFSIDNQQLDEASALLEQAYDYDKRGVFLAWQAQILTIKLVERFDTLDTAIKERSNELCEKAIKLDPTNSNVLASVANYKTIVERNEMAGIQLAKRAVRANPANPLAWWSLSNAVQYVGNTEHAYEAACRALQLSSGTRIEFWSAFQRSLAAMLNGKNEEALILGELSSALKPGFRPPLRYLAALYSTVDDVENGRRVLTSLNKNENDFSIDRFVNDQDYPVSIMRNKGLLNTDWIKQFE